MKNWNAVADRRDMSVTVGFIVQAEYKLFWQFPVLVADHSGESVDCSRPKVRRGGKSVTGENSLDN